jgi:hypothetical protein
MASRTVVGTHVQRASAPQRAALRALRPSHVAAPLPRAAAPHARAAASRVRCSAAAAPRAATNRLSAAFAAALARKQ